MKTTYHWMTERIAWQSLAIVSLIPAAVYAAVVLALMLGVDSPAVWCSQHLFDGPWAGVILVPLVAGGPLLGVICSLILGLQREGGPTLGKACGVLGWTLLILNTISLFPFPWILCVDID